MAATAEEWRAVEGYEGAYEVSDLGRVRRIERKAPDRNGVWKSRPGWDLNPWRTPGGRRKVGLSLSGKPRRESYVYRLVAQAFHPNPEGKPEVNHLNGKCHDDRAVNLEWATRRENMEHAIRLGLGSAGRGEAHPHAKLTEADVRQMRALAVTDRPAAIALGRSLGVSRAAACAAIDGRTWAHVE